MINENTLEANNCPTLNSQFRARTGTTSNPCISEIYKNLWVHSLGDGLTDFKVSDCEQGLRMIWGLKVFIRLVPDIQSEPFLFHHDTPTQS